MHKTKEVGRYHALKNSMKFGISSADSTEVIFFPCFSEMLCKSSFAPAPGCDTKLTKISELKQNYKQMWGEKSKWGHLLICNGSSIVQKTKIEVEVKQCKV